MKICAILAALALWLPGGDSYAQFQAQIPNGDQVPHPCKPPNIWHGVGHTNPLGGGNTNPFGHDFDEAGYQWTEALCRGDSDGDGRTNGQELGDPDCVWRPGNPPPSTQGISHPGICDPVGSSQCAGKNEWVDCTSDDTFNCDAIHEPDVRNITIRFPRTKVPAKETTYICFNFELPDDQEYHLIATQPLIDNKNVMHHIVLSRCASSVKLLDSPQECLMGAEECSELLDLWAVGNTGNCLIPQTGFRIGQGYTRMVSMQMHWTNPEAVDNWYDSSGMILYYTPKLRRYNAGILTIGQMSLNIPPGQNQWVEKGGCSGHCTEKRMTGDDGINMFRVIHHMHYLGNMQNTTLTRKGERQQMLVSEDDPFHYDSPVLHQLEPPMTVYPGDELTTYCGYQSRSRDMTTTYGLGSFEEMCFSFLYYYPEENMDTESFCTKYEDIDSCVAEEVCGDADFNLGNNATYAAMRKILDHCDASGMTCRKECPGAIREVMGRSRCMSQAWEYYLNIVYTYVPVPEVLKAVTALQSCGDPRRPGYGGGEVSTHKPPTHTTKKPDEHHTEHSTKPEVPEGPGGWLINLVKHLDARPLIQNIAMNINYNYGRAMPKRGGMDDEHHDDDDDDDGKDNSHDRDRADSMER